VEQLLIWHNSNRRTVLILEASGSDVEEIYEDCGVDLKEWPEDLGAYNQLNGLLIWEGEVNEDEEFSGSFRTLTEDETRRAMQNLSVLE
jgi:hypothetical protein